MKIETKFGARDKALIDMPDVYVPAYIVQNCPWRTKNRIIGYLIRTGISDVITVKFITGRGQYEVYSWHESLLDMRRIKIIPCAKRNKGE